MKVLILNGSPRLNGNTKNASLSLVKGIQENISGASVELIDVSWLKLSGCVGCDACKRNGGTCIQDDGIRPIIEKMYEADAIVFATPIYWWGISSQLKTVIDKMYSKTGAFQNQNKKIGIIVTAACPVDDIEYKMITAQFDCICKFLNWKLVFSKYAETSNLNSVSSNESLLKEFYNCYEFIAK